MKKYLIILAALLVQITAMSQVVMPFEPEKSVLLTDPANRMTHAPSTVITSDGMVYFTYYYDKAQEKEIGLSPTTEIGLDHFPLKSWKKPRVQRQTVMKLGETVGDFTQFKYPPYDPSLIDTGDGKFVLLFQGHQNNDQGKAIFRRVYDRKSGTFENHIDECRLNYNGKSVGISCKGLSEAFNDLLGVDMGEVETPVLNQEFFKEGEWWYNMALCFCNLESRPIIVRTKDFINYEPVFICKEFTNGACEGALVIFNDEFYIIARSCRPKTGMGCYMAKYSRDGECLVKPYRIGSTESRPVMKLFNGKIYAFYNTGPELKCEKWKVSRTRMRISELDSYALPVKSWDITNVQSIQYYNVVEYKGSLYMTFVSGRTPREYRQMKGDISFGKMNF